MKIKEELKEFKINHSTIEFETKESNCQEEECYVLGEEVNHHHHNHH